MARILAIDFGEKRTGIAVSDPTQTIANGLSTIETPNLMDFLVDYLAKEAVERFVVGMPKTLQNEPAVVAPKVQDFVKKLKTRFPNVAVELVDERFTSKLAFRAMIDGGLKKKKRQDKALIDKVSATIILQEYLENTRFKI